MICRWVFRHSNDQQANRGNLPSSIRDGSIKVWTTLAVSASLTKPP
jgi:hypothetical protein